MPARILPNVLFPAPFSPQIACTSPGATSKLTSSSATAPGKRLVMPVKRIAGDVIVSVSLRQRDVLRVDVREAPLLELPRPGPEVLLRYADEIHLHMRGNVFLEI